MKQKLFELIQDMTGYLCLDSELEEIIRICNDESKPLVGWLCPVHPSDIPRGWSWVAQDKCGDWYAYKKRPILRSSNAGFWYAKNWYAYFLCYDHININWQKNSTKSTD